MPKKFILILALGGVIPVLTILTFFIFYFNARSRVAQREGIQNPSAIQNLSSSPDWVQRSQSALRQLAEDPQLVQYLQQTDWFLAGERNPRRQGERHIVFQYLERFQDQHPEFEEIMLKNPQTGEKYLTVPKGALGEQFIGVRLLITIPVKSNGQGTLALLQGFVNLSRPGMPNRLNQPSQFLPPSGGKVAERTVRPTADRTVTRKIAGVFVLVLTFIVISIPTAMFFLYRKMKKTVNPPAPPPSYSSMAYQNRRNPASRRGRRQ
ncbi:MAG: hypothetical protein AB1611_01455 [bacterium]